MPDPGAATNEERVSELQQARFASFDQNGDRRVSRQEILDEFVRNNIARHWGRMVLFHLGRAPAAVGAVVPLDAGGGRSRCRLDPASVARGCVPFLRFDGAR